MLPGLLDKRRRICNQSYKINLAFRYITSSFLVQVTQEQWDMLEKAILNVKG